MNCPKKESFPSTLFFNRGKGETRVTFLEQQAIFGTLKGGDQVGDLEPPRNGKILRPSTRSSFNEFRSPCAAGFRPFRIRMSFAGA